MHFKLDAYMSTTGTTGFNWSSYFAQQIAGGTTGAGTEPPHLSRLLRVERVVHKFYKVRHWQLAPVYSSHLANSLKDKLKLPGLVPSARNKVSGPMQGNYRTDRVLHLDYWVT